MPAGNLLTEMQVMHSIRQLIDANATLWQFNAKFAVGNNIAQSISALHIHRLHLLYVCETQTGAKEGPTPPGLAYRVHMPTIMRFYAKPV